MRHGEDMRMRAHSNDLQLVVDHMLKLGEREHARILVVLNEGKDLLTGFVCDSMRVDVLHANELVAVQIPLVKELTEAAMARLLQDLLRQTTDLLLIRKLLALLILSLPQCRLDVVEFMPREEKILVNREVVRVALQDSCQ